MIAYLLAAFGLAFIIGHSKISLPFRRMLGGTPALPANPLSFEFPEGRPGVPGKFGPLGDFLCELIECPACFGFWIGFTNGILILAGVNLFNIELAPGEPSRFLPIVLGCITSGVNFLGARATGLTARP
jgi:hypothetical protein